MVSKWKGYIQISVDVIININTKKKRTRNNKYCIDCLNVNQKATIRKKLPLQLMYMKFQVLMKVEPSIILKFWVLIFI